MLNQDCSDYTSKLHVSSSRPDTDKIRTPPVVMDVRVGRGAGCERAGRRGERLSLSLSTLPPSDRAMTSSGAALATAGDNELNQPERGRERGEGERLAVWAWAGHVVARPGHVEPARDGAECSSGAAQSPPPPPPNQPTGDITRLGRRRRRPGRSCARRRPSAALASAPAAEIRPPTAGAPHRQHATAEWYTRAEPNATGAGAGREDSGIPD